MEAYYEGPSKGKGKGYYYDSPSKGKGKGGYYSKSSKGTIVSR